MLKAEMGCKVVDWIWLESSGRILCAFNENSDYIKQEIID
jgi:hypothetical protein